MWEWIKGHIPLITAFVLGICLVVYSDGCQSQVRSLLDNGKYVTRGEFNIELDKVLATAELRNIELDKKDALRNLILQNALVLGQGQPLNPLGIITGMLGIYGVGSAVSATRKKFTVVKAKEVTNGESTS